MTTMHDDDTAEGNRNTGRHGRWDPFKTFRRILSPDERMALLRVKRPVQPPEDFMNTVELKLLRAAQRRDQLRHISPALIGLGTFVVVLVFAILWWRSPSLDPVDAAALPSKSVAMAANTQESPPPVPHLDSTLKATAQAQSPSPSTAPLERAPAPVQGATALPHASPTPTSPRAPGKASPPATGPVPAAKVQPRPPDDLDLDTPMAPPVH